MLSAGRLGTLVAFLAIATLAMFAIAGRTQVGGLAATLVSDGPTSNDRFIVKKVAPASRLRVGDRVEIDGPGELAAFNLDSLRYGSTFTLRRLGPPPATIAEPVTTMPLRLLGAPLIAALELLFIGSAAFIALRGRTGGSLPLAWLFALIVLLFNPTTPDWPPGAILIYAIAGGPIAVVAFWCAAQFAVGLVNDSGALWVRRFRRVALAITFVAIVVNVYQSCLAYFTPDTPVVLATMISGVFLAQAICFFSGLVLAYVKAPPGERQRITWVAASVGLGILGFVATVLAGIAGVAEPLRDYPLLLLLAMPLGCGYAILRYRLLDIAFVVNRATVFGVTSLLVLGAVALIETGLEAFLGTWLFRSGLYVQLGLAVAIGIATRPLHERVDRIVDDLFFRARHEAERTLRVFAQDVAHIDDAEVAVRRTVDVVARAAQMRCEIFLVTPSGSYAPAAASDDAAASPVIDRNDGTIVRLLATRNVLDVHDVDTVLGGHFAFPMFARNRLGGLLVCGRRGDDDTTYAPDELDAIATVARATALALDLLRIEALESELDTWRRGARLPSAM